MKQVKRWVAVGALAVAAAVAGVAVAPNTYHDMGGGTSITATYHDMGACLDTYHDMGSCGGAHPDTYHDM